MGSVGGLWVGCREALRKKLEICSQEIKAASSILEGRKNAGGLRERGSGVAVRNALPPLACLVIWGQGEEFLVKLWVEAG